MPRDRPAAPTKAFPVHVWPLDVQGHRFELGRLVESPEEVVRAYANERLGHHPGAGRWECALRAGDALTWSDEVYDIFGVPRGVHVTRAEAVTYYCDHSRVLMERLRADAIGRKLGFVLDAEMQPGHGPRHCWMRLVAAPVVEDGEVVRLEGFKQII